MALAFTHHYAAADVTMVTVKKHQKVLGEPAERKIRDCFGHRLQKHSSYISIAQTQVLIANRLLLVQGRAPSEYRAG